jgi:hypothetical protein
MAGYLEEPQAAHLGTFSLCEHPPNEGVGTARRLAASAPR